MTTHPLPVPKLRMSGDMLLTHMPSWSGQRKHTHIDTSYVLIHIHTHKGDQTTDHLIYQCTLLQQQRGRLEKDTFQHGIWPISKHELITKHLKSFMKFTNSIGYDKL